MRAKIKSQNKCLNHRISVVHWDKDSTDLKILINADCKR